MSGVSRLNYSPTALFQQACANPSCDAFRECLPPNMGALELLLKVRDFYIAGKRSGQIDIIGLYYQSKKLRETSSDAPMRFLAQTLSCYEIVSLASEESVVERMSDLLNGHVVAGMPKKTPAKTLREISAKVSQFCQEIVAIFHQAHFSFESNSQMEKLSPPPSTSLTIRSASSSLSAGRDSIGTVQSEAPSEASVSTRKTTASVTSLDQFQAILDAKFGALSVSPTEEAPLRETTRKTVASVTNLDQFQAILYAKLGALPVSPTEEAPSEDKEKAETLRQKALVESVLGLQFPGKKPEDRVFEVEAVEDEDGWGEVVEKRDP